MQAPTKMPGELISVFLSLVNSALHLWAISGIHELKQPAWLDREREEGEGSPKAH